MISVYGLKVQTTDVKNVFTLLVCLPIVLAKVIPCGAEAELLCGWRGFSEISDPDIITGYNI